MELGEYHHQVPEGNTSSWVWRTAAAAVEAFAERLLDWYQQLQACRQLVSGHKLGTVAAVQQLCKNCD